MVRHVYSLLFYLAQPLIWLRLLWRARRQPEYLQHLGERYGFYAQTVPDRLLWLHAVSVGETRAAEPLIKALLDAYPDHLLLLTHMTPTGRATGVVGPIPSKPLWYSLPKRSRSVAVPSTASRSIFAPPRACFTRRAATRSRSFLGEQTK